MILTSCEYLSFPFVDEVIEEVVEDIVEDIYLIEKARSDNSQ